MLGLGDIVIPGIFVALLLRYDAVRHFKQARYFHRCVLPGLATCSLCVSSGYGEGGCTRAQQFATPA